MTDFRHIENLFSPNAPTYSDVYQRSPRYKTRMYKEHLCSFRISAYRLQTETGSYIRSRVEAHLCSACNKLEDAFHFMFECEKYRVDRNKFEILNEQILFFRTVTEEIL